MSDAKLDDVGTDALHWALREYANKAKSSIWSVEW